jgi:hypothetical protein
MPLESNGSFVWSIMGRLLKERLSPSGKIFERWAAVLVCLAVKPID